MNTINQLRFDYEQQLFQELSNYPDIQTWQQQASRQAYFSLHKRHLLGTTVRITDKLLPELNKIYQDCLALISQDISGYLYVYQSSDYNARVYSHEKQFDILLTSALVKDFKAAEVAFVIGHELGHVLFEHQQIPATNLLFEEHNTPITPALAKQLFQWSRAAEISADRVGFLACGNLSSAANAFFKTASGLHLNDDNRIVQALRAQFDEIKALTAHINSVQSLGISTHPLIPIRFKSLELISLDLLAFRNDHKALRIRDLQAINREVQTVLVQTDPVNLDTLIHTPPSLANQQFLSLLILCLLSVAISDAPLNTTEETFVRAIVERANHNVQIDEVLLEYRANSTQFKTILLTEIASCQVTQDQMLEILHHCSIMCPKPKIMEIEAMRALCMTLNSNVALVDSIFSV